MPAIDIYPRNALALKATELHSLERNIAAVAPPGIDVRLLSAREMPLAGGGVTRWEVVGITLSDVSGDLRGAVVNIILDRFQQWARERFRRKRAAELGPDRKPKCIVISFDDPKSEAITCVLRDPRGRLVSRETGTRSPALAKRKRKRSGKRGR